MPRRENPAGRMRLPAKYPAWMKSFVEFGLAPDVAVARRVQERFEACWDDFRERFALAITRNTALTSEKAAKAVDAAVRKLEKAAAVIGPEAVARRVPSRLQPPPDDDEDADGDDEYRPDDEDEDDDGEDQPDDAQEQGDAGADAGDDAAVEDDADDDVDNDDDPDDDDQAEDHIALASDEAEQPQAKRATKAIAVARARAKCEAVIDAAKASDLLRVARLLKDLHAELVALDAPS